MKTLKKKPGDVGGSFFVELPYHKRYHRLDMAKAGDDYQNAVADVVKHLDPEADVQTGQWIAGPDGERDCDVAVYATAPGGWRFIIIECKDWKRRVGIEVVDALESKRRDIKANQAIICSNSGFTRDARSKAARVQIITMSALKENDRRIRVKVEEEIYTRKISVKPERFTTTIHFNHPEVPMFSRFDKIFHDNRPVAAWFEKKCEMLLFMKCVHPSTISAKYKFRRPLQFHFDGHVFPAIGWDLSISADVQWCSQIVEIGASAGMYDYLRHRVIFGKGTHQYHIKNLDIYKGTPMSFVPEHLKQNPTGTPAKGEMNISLALVTGLENYGDAPSPDIDDYIESEEVSIVPDPA